MTSWKIFSIQGIGMRIHWTLILLFAALFLIGFTTQDNPLTLPAMWFLLFASVGLHELSHSLAAKKMGIQIKEIVLLPIGGMAIMKQTNFEPKKEFLMAMAGPFFNFTVCALIILLQLFTGFYLYGWNEFTDAPLLFETGLLISFVLSTLFWLNLVLGTFNLLPAIPMDGGRMLRSGLAMFMDYLKATRLATLISNILMSLMFLAGFYIGNLWFIIIAAFIFVSSRAELEATISNRLLGDFPLTKLVKQTYLVVDDDDMLDKVLKDMIESTSLVAFYKEKGKIYSVNIYDIQRVPKKIWKKTKFLKIAREQHPVTQDHSASFAVNKMNELGLEALSVIDKKQEIIGCVFKDDIEVVLEILKISRA
ncbi:site-2 protease family protein [archaeon]|nr:site-2 protease family protein [archaeon]